jgi:type II secretory pathway component GspD/PulD (secretin)
LIMRRLLISTVTTAVMLLEGCGTVNTSIREEISQNEENKKRVFESPLQIVPASRVSEVRGTLMPVTPVTSVNRGDWLKKYRVQLEIKNPTPMTAVVAKLAEQGINITSDLPLDNYTYVGKINPTDGESALKLVLGAVGLDYQVDDVRKMVVIKPMSSRTWILNIGNRKSTYSSDGQIHTSSVTGLGNNMNQVGGSSPGAAVTPMTGGAGGVAAGTQTGAGGMGAVGVGSQPAGGTATGQNVVSANASGTGVASTDDFWSSLANELNNRLSVMIPRSMITSRQAGNLMPPLPTSGLSQLPPPIPPSQLPPLPGANGMSADASEIYVRRQIGTYSINPETGAITVQAPHWILNDLDTYIKRVQEMYNTDISFIGELVTVTSNRTDSEGIDISAFARWASERYNAVISNNALGGITVSFPSDLGAPLVQANAQPVAGPILGLSYARVNNALDIFNAYLSEIGKLSIIQRPLITTTSGIPGVFSKRFVDYYNTVSQQAVAGGIGSAATATQNVLVPVELGTELRINPRIDVTTGLIRAQITLNQVIRSGSKTIPQTITYGNNATTINTTIPLLTKQTISGEVLVRDGDLIVVGGQTEDNLSNDENGLPGRDGPIGGLLGIKKASRGTQTYYFALRVAVNKRQ